MTNSILDKIVAYKKEEVAHNKKNKPLSQLHSESPQWERRDFVAAIKNHRPAVIAEIKKASPSKGIIRQNFDPVKIAESYEQHQATCLSVLTDQGFFQGDPSYLGLVKEHCSLPLLRKDFIIDPYQILESHYLGADCILLIVAILDDFQLQNYCQAAMGLGLAVLVETHSLEEFERALKLPTPLLGVNNRNLHTFHTDLQTSIDLAQLLPKDKILISESGIHSAQDIKRLQEAGINAFLIGESLMSADNPGEKLTELLHGS